MKNYLLYILTGALLFTVGCSKDKVETVKPVSLQVQVSYESDQAGLNLPLAQIKVKITNSINGQSYDVLTNDQGLAVFESVVPGNYQATASVSFTGVEYTGFTGILTADDVTFNASAETVLQTDDVIQLVLKPGRIGDLVFKQIYYAGSNTSQGASFRDEFVEIYNNSNDVIYADSLYFGSTWANNKALSAGEVSFDWSQSVGMPGNIGNPTNDYIYARYLFMIPGSGKDHPIQPGESIIVAQTALNHTQPYIDNSGKEQGITDPTLTVDLSNADFETYLVDYKRAQSADPDNFNPYRWDLDNPQVPNVEVVHLVSGQDWVMDALGRDDFFMFKSNENVQSWASYPDPTVTTVNSTTSMYKQIPVKYVIDAVEIKRPITTQQTPKRLPVALDGEGTFVDGGQYSSQSLIRKTLKTINGRRILQDTNNSKADFDTKQKADPSKSPASFSAN